MNKKLKIGYFADGPWSWAALELIARDEDCEILFIVPRIGSQDTTLRQLAQRYGIPYLENQLINSPEFTETISKYDFNLFVSMSFDQIFKEKILKVPALGTINCHAGKLPFYRGRNVLNWALINDEREIGVTVHYIDQGIDTGDIIHQVTFPVSDEDDYGTVLEKAYVGCSTALHKALKLISSGEATVTKQSSIHPLGLYCGKRVPGDEVLDWNQTSREVFNFVRAITVPGPGARTKVNGHEVKILSSRYFKEAPAYKGVPGQILARTRDGYLVKTIDSYVEITKYESPVVLRVGERFCK